MQVGSMNEEAQVKGCLNITFIYTNRDTVCVYWKRHKQTKQISNLKQK